MVMVVVVEFRLFGWFVDGGFGRVGGWMVDEK